MVWVTLYYLSVSSSKPLLALDYLYVINYDPEMTIDNAPCILDSDASHKHSLVFGFCVCAGLNPPDHKPTLSIGVWGGGFAVVQFGSIMQEWCFYIRGHVKWLHFTSVLYSYADLSSGPVTTIRQQPVPLHTDQHDHCCCHVKSLLNDFDQRSSVSGTK